MKKLFYLSLVLLLCVSCSKEEMFPEQKGIDGLETRAAGTISMEMEGSTVHVQWDKPFGDGYGIWVSVYDERNPSQTLGILTTFSDTTDGHGIHLNVDPKSLHGVNPKAKVRSYYRDSRGNAVMGDEIRTMTIFNKDNPLNYPCTHQFLPEVGSRYLEVVIPSDWSSFTIYRNARNTSMYLITLTFGDELYGYSTGILGSTFGVVSDNWRKVQIPPYGLSKVPHGTKANIEIRLYDMDCPKINSPTIKGFPACPTYYKFKFELSPGERMSSNLYVTH